MSVRLTDDANARAAPRNRGRPIASERVEARSKGLGLATVPGALVVVLSLVMIAVIETLARVGRRAAAVRSTLVVRLAAACAVMGVLLVGIAWLLGGPEPSSTSALVCAVTGALAGVLLGVTPRGANPAATAAQGPPPRRSVSV